MLFERLEDQMNDTVELHQAEVLNLKQEIQSLSARLQYQNDERYRDIQDLVENSQNRVSQLLFLWTVAWPGGRGGWVPNPGAASPQECCWGLRPHTYPS